MLWRYPHISKIYEALGAIADERIEISGNTAKVYSSSRAKFYDVEYDPEKNAIMSNDNASFWKETLGYPSIAFLMKIKVLSYDPHIGELLKGIAWKDINQKFKNDFDKTIEYILESKTPSEREEMKNFVEKVSKEIQALNIEMLGQKQRPPAGY